MSEKKTGREYRALEIAFAVSVLSIPYLLVQLLAIFLFLLLILVLGSFLIIAFVGIAQLVAGVALVGIGIEKLFSIPMGAFAIMGFGIMNIGIALLLECFVLWLYGVAIPFGFRKIVKRGTKNEKIS